MLTVAQLYKFVKLSLRGDTSSVLPSVELANMAGRYVTGMHRWRWLQRPPAFVGTTISQSFSTLPADVGEIISLEPAGGSTPILTKTTLDAINRRRAGSTGTGKPYLWALDWSALSGTTLPAPRIEWFETPNATDASAYNLMYRAAWVDLANDTDIIPLPRGGWLDTLFIQVAIAHARGFEESAKGSIDARLREIANGELFHAALREDCSKQTDFGRIEGDIDQYRGNLAITILGTVGGP